MTAVNSYSTQESDFIFWIGFINLELRENDPRNMTVSSQESHSQAETRIDYKWNLSIWCESILSFCRYKWIVKICRTDKIQDYHGWVFLFLVLQHSLLQCNVNVKFTKRFSCNFLSSSIQSKKLLRKPKRLNNFWNFLPETSVTNDRKEDPGWSKTLAFWRCVLLFNLVIWCTSS